MQETIRSFITQPPFVIAVYFLMLPGFSTLAFGILVENSDSQQRRAAISLGRQQYM